MNIPLMPLATALWLVENTALTFAQIAGFCKLHEMEVQSIADGEIADHMQAQSPLGNGQLSAENLKECEEDANKKLVLITDSLAELKAKKKVTKYIPINKRRDKPNAVYWVVKNYPDIPETKIAKLIGSTKKTVESIKNRTYSNITQLETKDPVALGFCTQTELDEIIAKFTPSQKS